MVWLKLSGRLERTLLVGFAAVLVGCAHQAPKPLYDWGNFQGQLYEHFKADSSRPDDQLRLLEEQQQKAQMRGAALPPGFRAHLAMVYLRLGREVEARVQMEAEKAAFPESAQYMDFLLKRMTDVKS